MLHIPVYLHVCAVISLHRPSRRYTAETSSFLFHPTQGFLHCVTTELKGGICDLISPGNIKKKQCFIHRHKAPEFTQIKFARLCLRDQAWGLTHIEMIGFLRLIYKKRGGREGEGYECSRGQDDAFSGSLMRIGTFLNNVRIGLTAEHVYFLFCKFMIVMKNLYRQKYCTMAFFFSSLFHF